MKFEFELSTVIQKPVNTVVQKFRDRSMYTKWQPGIHSSEKISGHPHDEYQHTVQLGRRKIIMTETILEDELPEQYLVTYKLRGIRSLVRYRFVTTAEGHTQWFSHESYQFKGLMILSAWFLRDGLKQQSRILMNNFKRMVEKE